MNKNLAFYYSFKKKPMIRKSCKNDYIIDKNTIPKSGAYGSVSEVCKNKNCNYIVKAIPFKNAYTKQSFIREALIAPMMDKVNVGPKIYDIFTCLNVGYIVMDKWQGTLSELFFRNLNFDIDKYFDDIFKLIKKMHNNNVIHNDLHTGNILYKKDKKGKYTFCINDFGLSIYFENKNMQISEKYVPRINVPNFFFPSYDYYVFSNKLEKIKKKMFSIFFTDKLISLKDYVIINKYQNYIDNIKPLVLKGIRSDITFYNFLKNNNYTKYLITDIKSNINYNNNNNRHNIPSEYLYTINAQNNIVNKNNKNNKNIKISTKNIKISTKNGKISTKNKKISTKNKKISTKKRKISTKKN